MPTVTTLHDLVTTLSSAITSAQDTIERHYLSLIRQYFDDQGRPYSLDIKIPAVSSVDESQSIRQITVPVLALVESRALGISSCEISLDVELTGIEALAPPPAAQQAAGAPIDVPNLSTPQADALLAMGVDAAPAHSTFAAKPSQAVGVRVDTAASTAGPVAKLVIRVEERPASEALSRLVTHLNTLI